MDTRTIILDSMQKTIFVLSYMGACDAWDTYQGEQKAKLRPPGTSAPDDTPIAARPVGLRSARGGEDWFAVVDEYIEYIDDCTEFMAACRDDAAILYGRAVETFGMTPAAVLLDWYDRHTRDPDGPALPALRTLADKLGYYLVMHAVGHGVSWTDRFDPFTHLNGDLRRWPSGYDVPSFPVEYPPTP